MLVMNNLLFCVHDLLSPSFIDLVVMMCLLIVGVIMVLMEHM